MTTKEIETLKHEIRMMQADMRTAKYSRRNYLRKQIKKHKKEIKELSQEMTENETS